MALAVMTFFVLIARWSRRLIESFPERRGHQLSAGLVIGLGSALVILLGLLVSFK
jgi:hypothetical protein